ncbi:hypothetical protein UFOVP116_179 [uncultured Caudovirales phage]|uniref:Uncharacterized protein n=1 Tax=uncultured Caudovirales phage TaxID=2100421 RepID=A0A6J5LE51_9CAUD|nr:hypothetical protein UFOVP116_179 [uncultured Caudovirales phage]
MSMNEILKEMPYLHPGEMPRHILDTGISNGTNIEDARVWTNSGNFNGSEIVLILTK